jgi:hypothetical protein
MFVTAVSCFTWGYLVRATEQSAKTNTINEVGIVERYDTFSYKLRYDGQDYDTKFCRGVVPTFEPGEKLRWLTYIDETYCWNIGDHGAGFKYYKENGKAIKFAELTR